MLSNTLITNEVKNAAGTEEEFTRLQFSDARSTEFARVSEQPAYPHRLSISHTETGVGVSKRRRSVVRFDKTVVGQVDTTTTMKTSFYFVLDAPVGQMTSNALITDVIANGMSFLASLGGSTTILYDGTGNGAAALISGGL
jgi:hypothetical protein